MKTFTTLSIPYFSICICLAICLLLSAGTFPTFSEGDSTALKNKALRKELREYFKKNILPVLQKQRAKLDAQMNSNDRKQLQNVKSQIEAVKSELKAFRPELKQYKVKGQEIPEDLRNQLFALRTRIRSHFGSLKTLAQKYDNQIQSLFGEISAEKQTWEKEIRGIFIKYIGEEKLVEIKKPMGRHFLRKKLSKTAFLLVKPEKPSIDGSISIFPNPATSVQYIQFDLEEDTQLKVELLNDQGEVVQLITEGFRQAGNFTFPVNTTELEKEVYFYRITQGDKMTTRRILVR